MENKEKFTLYGIIIFVLVLIIVSTSLEIQRQYEENKEVITKEGIIIDIDIESMNKHKDVLYVYFDDGDYILIEDNIRENYAQILPFKNKEVIFRYLKVLQYFDNEFIDIKEKSE